MSLLGAALLGILLGAAAIELLHGKCPGMMKRIEDALRGLAKRFGMLE
ncbi:MAG TPA: hypothetical protein HPP77_09285 [Candidatus Hydrogenedentes bacterium]|nr:hypothetical protein [Candidatus Hydrogenedentota bacterium]